MSDSLSIAPGHIQQTKVALRDAGIPVAIGQQVLDLATAFYHAPPPGEPNGRHAPGAQPDSGRAQNGQQQQERQKTQRLEQALAAALTAPKSHQKEGIPAA